MFTYISVYRYIAPPPLRSALQQLFQICFDAIFCKMCTKLLPNKLLVWFGAERSVWVSFESRGFLRMSGYEAFKGALRVFRCGANIAHIGQSRPDSGLDFQIKVLDTFEVVPPTLGSRHPQRAPTRWVAFLDPARLGGLFSNDSSPPESGPRTP